MDRYFLNLKFSFNEVETAAVDKIYYIQYKYCGFSYFLVGTNFLGLRKADMFMDILFWGLAKVYII